MKFKSLLTLVLAIAMAITFAGCGAHYSPNNLILAHVDEDITLVKQPVVEEDHVAVAEHNPILFHGPKEIEKVEPAPIPVAKVTRINIIGDILFPFDKSIITDDQQANVDKLVALMKEYPDTKIEILGYACFMGSEEYNMPLSQRRADAVKADMVSQGVDADRLVATGKGEVNIFGAILKLNRRAVIRSID